MSLEIKLSGFNSILTSVFNSNGLPGSNVSVGVSDKNKDIAPRIEGCKYAYMYDGKLGMHVPEHLTSQETLNC